jgi:hypothetical protein
MTDEQKKERLAILQAEVGELEQENKANSIIKSQIQSKEEFEEGKIKDAASEFPGAVTGGLIASKMVPPLGHPYITGGAKVLAGLGGAITGSEVTGPYVKPYTDAAYDALTDPKNKQVIALGDDFNQGQLLFGAPSVIDNSVVPYETVDSSSTGVLRHAPQLR